MTVDKLAEMKNELLAQGVDVEAMEASDLYRPGLGREARNVLSLDLLRRRCDALCAARS